MFIIVFENKDPESYGKKRKDTGLIASLFIAETINNVYILCNNITFFASHIL